MGRPGGLGKGGPDGRGIDGPVRLDEGAAAQPPVRPKLIEGPPGLAAAACSAAPVATASSTVGRSSGRPDRSASTRR
jgi:hypothetical protein